MKGKRKTADVVFQGLEAGLRMFRWVVVILLVLFLVSGVTKIEPDSVGLLLRFGKLQGLTPGEQVKQPGLLLALPFPIDNVKRVPGKEREEEVVIDEVWNDVTQEVTTDKIDPVLEGYCLTGDQNILQAKLAVKYRVTDPIAFELWMDQDDREALLRDVVLAALVQTVARWKMDDALRLERSEASPEPTSGADPAETTASETAEAADAEALETNKERLAQTVWRRAQERLDALSARGESRGCGMTISALEFKEVHPPRHVIAEFRRVQDEEITKETARQNAKAFESREIPDAKAQKNRMEQSARAFKDTLVATANAELSEFQLLHEQYEKSPALVWERIYQEAIEAVLSNVKQLRFVTPGDRVIIPEKEKTPEFGEKQP